MNRLACMILLLALPASAHLAPLTKIFNDYNLTGTLVISSLKDNETFIHNPQRAAQLFSPASTFKILNTLIAVDEGVVSGPSATFDWDGVQRSYTPWNQDQTLASAFKYSCVWCYQRIAREVGAEVYRQRLRDLSYGELRSDFSVDQFWLDGGLRVSAFEQIQLLKAIHQRTLPFSANAFNTLQQIMVETNQPEYTLSAKTGWAADVAPQIGWYVGFVETETATWFFALNINIENDEDLAYRKEIVHNALSLLGVIAS